MEVIVMSFSSDICVLVPRNGHTLVTGIVARISGCENQTEMSNDDQVDHGKEVSADLYSGPTEFKIIATKAKGERLDRAEFAELEEILRRGDLDLLIMEDLGRLVRGTEAAWLMGIAVDHGTRCVSPDDGVDTIDPSWEQNAVSTCAEHVGNNARTSWRIKNKLNIERNVGSSCARWPLPRASGLPTAHHRTRRSGPHAANGR